MKGFRYTLVRPFDEGTLEDGLTIASSISQAAERMMKHGLETYGADITVIVKSRKGNDKLITTRWAQEM